jgi:hypothetical protein
VPGDGGILEDGFEVAVLHEEVLRLHNGLVRLARC